MFEGRSPAQLAAQLKDPKQTGGKTLEQAETIKNSDIVEELDLPPVKIHCSVLAEDAIKSAIADYRQKQAARAPSKD